MSESADFWRTAMRKGMGEPPSCGRSAARSRITVSGHGRMRLPFQPFLVGNPDTGVIHGGVLTGAAGSGLRHGGRFGARDRPRMIATLDLRIDYMKPAQAGDRPHHRVASA